MVPSPSFQRKEPIRHCFEARSRRYVVALETAGANVLRPFFQPFRFFGFADLLTKPRQVLQNGRHLRVVRPQRLFADGQRPPGKRLGISILASGRLDFSQIV